MRKGMSKTAIFYRENKDSREAHQAYNLEHQKKPSAVRKRVELNRYNREHGTYGNGDGLDAAHHNGKITGFKKQSLNRGDKNDSAGDRRARGGKTKIHNRKK